MRQYRGLTKDGKWVYGYYCDLGGLSYIAEYSVGAGRDVSGKIIGGWIEVIPETVGQSIGRKDENDEEIYEGDKVKIKPMYLGFMEGVVSWNISYASYQVEALDTRWLFDGIESIEIIGNVHQKGVET